MALLFTTLGTFVICELAFKDAKACLTTTCARRTPSAVIHNHMSVLPRETIVDISKKKRRSER